ncbi:MAG: peptidoglycan DD-metalloendopeptidase family protein [Bacteroidales bacterium]|nr:peptidoglycan DD-metalloendopeptidase family protein [Bacteroidales bacterium]
MNKIRLLDKSIKAQVQHITQINTEIGLLDNEIVKKNYSIRDLQAIIKEIKKEYAALIVLYQKGNRPVDKAAFILSSGNALQAYRRLKHLRELSMYRKKQADVLRHQTIELQKQKLEISNLKSQKVNLKSGLESEKTKLSSSRTERSKTLKELSKKESEIQKNLTVKKKQAAELQRTIERIIAEEIARAERERKESGSEKPAKSEKYTFSMTPEEQALSDDFAKNSGKLPWPVERGVISEGFGEHPHPVLKNIKTQNNGINILTYKESFARSIFEGKVTRVMKVSGYNHVIIIRHGDYLSVYSNIREVLVKVGDNVRIKQSLGVIETNQNSEAEVQLQIWKGKTLLNPELWLSK